MGRSLRVAVAGATGAVGIEMVKTLEKRNFPISELKLLASARSAGKTMKFKGEDVVIQEMTKDSLNCKHFYHCNPAFDKIKDHPL